MKYTMLYLKYLVIVVLCIIMVIGFILGILCACLGIFGTAQECNLGYLVLLPAGIFFGFMGFVALDCLKHLVDVWELSKS